MVIYGADKKSPKPYNGGRDASSIVAAVVAEVQSVATSRVSGKKAGGKPAGGNGGSGGKPSGGSGGGSGEFGGKHITTLTSTNFADEVLASTDPWIVTFYAPWW